MPGPEWDYEVPSYSPQELLYEEGEPLGEGRLRELFCDSFQEEWIKHDVWVGDRHDNLLNSWLAFVEHVKRRARFVFLIEPSENEMGVPGEVAPAGMLAALIEELVNSDAIVPHAAGQPVYRGRKHPAGEILSSAAELGPPRDAEAGPQRMSPTGIAFFYGATNIDTCLAELRGRDGECATVAEWVTVRQIWICDLDRLLPVPSIFDQSRAAQRSSLIFLHRFRDEIAKPLSEYDVPEVDYVATQVVAEFLRHAVRSVTHDPIEGISYPSTAHPGGSNIAFFAGPDGCRDLHDEQQPQHLLAMTRNVGTFEVASAKTSWRRARQSAEPTPTR